MTADSIIRGMFLAGFLTVIAVMGWHYVQTGDKWIMFPKLSRPAKWVCLIGFGLIAVACVAGVVKS